MFGRWVEVFASTDPGEVAGRENALGDHGVRYRTRLDDSSQRLRMNRVGGMESAALACGGPSAVTYRILVKREDAETARYLFGRIK